MLNALMLDSSGRLREGTTPKTCEAILFGGHVGCGKSTELRDYGRLFASAYTVRHLELTKSLDISNLRFSDLVIALAKELVATEANGKPLELHPVFIDPVLEWFDTRIIKQERFKDIDGEIKGEVKAKGGIPFLVSILATITTKVRGGASYREELRREIRDGFLALLTHFNALVAHANTLLKEAGCGPLIFIIDGTDKLSRPDADAFFNGDINQVALIETNLVICAPIAVLIEGSTIGQRFSRVQLPMVKIFDADQTPRQSEENALIALVLKRMPIEHFDNIETVRYLVQMSGGHVRDLLRLVSECFTELDRAPITADHAHKAARAVASQYQRLVQKDDWTDLVAVDRSHGEDKNRTDARLRLLYDLALLEYNDYWWRSHPLLSTFKPYLDAHAAAEKVALDAHTSASSSPR